MGHAVSIQPVSADISRTLNEFGKRSRLHDIAVRTIGLTASEVMLVVRSGEDDDGDCGEARIGLEPFQQSATVLVAEVKVEKNKGRQGRVVCPALKEMKRPLGVLFGKKSNLKAGLFQRQTKQFPLAWTVFD